MKLVQYIKNKYVDADRIINVLKKYQVFKEIDALLYTIQSKILTEDAEVLTRNAGLLLTKVNPLLTKIESREDKRIIELFIVELIDPFIRKIIDSDQTGLKLNEIVKSLTLACELNGYNKNELFQLLGLERYDILKTVDRNDYWYAWNRKPFQLDSFAKHLRSKEILVSPWKVFTKLFEPSPNREQIHYFAHRGDLLLVLFAILSERKDITPKGTNGKFAPLNKYAVDVEGEKLFKVAPNKRIERIKRNPKKYDQLRFQAMILINY